MRKIEKLAIAIVVVVGMVWITSGCVSLKDYNKMVKKHDMEKTDLEKHRQALAAAKAKLAEEYLKLKVKSGDLQAENTSLKAKLRAEQEARLKFTENLARQLGKIPGVEIIGPSAEIQGEVLFNPGRARLKESGKEVLSQVAEVFKQHPEYIIRIEGHTDTDPINRSKHRWTTGSNFELAAYRALKVLLYFEEQGINPTRMYLCSFGEHRPKGENKIQNRRVVIGFEPLQLEKSTGTEEELHK